MVFLDLPSGMRVKHGRLAGSFVVTLPRTTTATATLSGASGLTLAAEWAGSNAGPVATGDCGEGGISRRGPRAYILGGQASNPDFLWADRGAKWRRAHSAVTGACPGGVAPNLIKHIFVVHVHASLPRDAWPILDFLGVSCKKRPAWEDRNCIHQKHRSFDKKKKKCREDEKKAGHLK